MVRTEFTEESDFVEGVVVVSATAPVNPKIGRLWLDTSSPGSDATLAIETITGATTLDNTHSVVLCNATGGAFTVTLPAAVDNPGRRYYIKKIDSSANAVTIDGNAAETIDEATTQILRDQYATLAIVSDGSEWWIL